MSKQSMGEGQTKLVNALVEAGADKEIISLARNGMFDDYKSEHPTPCALLVSVCEVAGLRDIADRARKGEFDATKADADAWRNSPEGIELMGAIERGE